MEHYEEEKENNNENNLQDGIDKKGEIMEHSSLG